MRSSARKVAHLRLAPRPHDELEGLRRQRAMWRARAHVLEAAYYGGLSPDVAESQRELALRGAALDAAERTLADLRSEVGAAAERIAEARQRSDELVELRRQLEDRESALLAQRSVVETAAAQLEEVRVELSARADTLAARERELERTSKTVDELANECRQLRDELAHATSALVGGTVKVSEASALTAHREGELAARLEGLEKKEAEFATRSSRMDEREQELDSAEARLVHEATQVDSARESLRVREKEAAARERKAERLRRESANRGDSVARGEEKLAAEQAALMEAREQLARREKASAKMAKAVERTQREVDARVRGAEQLQAELARAADELQVARTDLARREAELAARESTLAEAEASFAKTRTQSPTPGPEATAVLPQRQPVQQSRWQLVTLERVVQEHAQAQPERLEEWQCYLEALREVADGDGRLPQSVDWLIEETFGNALSPAEARRS